jgi:drug/metabolite transporter (DMT)-like permease
MPARIFNVSIAKQMGPREWLMLIALSILWGGSFFFVGVAVKELPPITIVAIRVALGAFILLTICRLMGLKLPRDIATWKSFGLMGMFNNIVPFCLIVWAQTQIASGVASIFNAATPLFTVLVAHVMTQDEKMTPLKMLGVVIGFVGVAVMIGPAALLGDGTSVFAQLALVGATVSYAFTSIYGRRFKALGIEPLTITTCQLTAASVVLIPLSLLIDTPWTLAMPSAATVASLIAIAALSTALAYMLYFRILATAGATNLSLVTFLIPVSAILLGVLFLSEHLEVKHLIGMALIAAGLVAIDGRLLKRS